VSRSPVRSFIHVVCVVLSLIAVSSLAACGGDSEGSDEGSQKLTFTLQGEGQGSRVTGPKDADTGLAEIALVNGSKKEGQVQLVRADGKHSDQEVADALKEAIEGKAFPDWFFAAGGVGSAPAGDLRTVKQVLQPGTYYPFNAQAGTVKPKFVVKGESSDTELEADATITAVEYGFEAEGLSPGRSEVAYVNAGEEPHQLLIAPLLGDSTAAEVESFFKEDGKGKAPLDQKHVQSTTVIEGGESQLITLDLKPGRYVLYCFVGDRQGSEPHALKGQVDEVEVE
jgi:hypothetical protein